MLENIYKKNNSSNNAQESNSSARRKIGILNNYSKLNTLFNNQNINQVDLPLGNTDVLEEILSNSITNNDIIDNDIIDNTNILDLNQYYDQENIQNKNVNLSNDNIHINDIKKNGTFYNPYTNKSGNKAWRNNNPGNITGMSGLKFGASKIAHSNFGDKGDRKMLIFDTPEAGWRAMYNLMSSKSYNNAPAYKAFAKWQTDKKAWNNIIKESVNSGVNMNKKFIDMTPQEKAAFMNIRARHEGWTGEGINSSFFTKN